MTNDDVQNIIEQLKELQILQSELLFRLEKARTAETHPEDADEAVKSKPVGPTASKEPILASKEPIVARKFAIGD